MLFAITCGLLGCAPTSAVDGCETVCATEVACDSDTGAIPVDEQACVETCLELSDEAAYADAVSERAACIDGLPRDERCDLFACRPSGE